MNFKTKMRHNKKQHETLRDILPKNGNLEILFIAKRVSKSGYVYGSRA